MKDEPERDLFRSISIIVIVVILIAASIWILKPFLPALIWATMIAVATWPMLLAVQARLGHKRWLAVLVMTIALLLVFAIPFSFALGTLIVHVEDITSWARTLDLHALDTPPQWIAKLPGVGAQLDSSWREFAGSGDLGSRAAPYAGELVSWLFAQLGSLGAVVLQFLLTVVIAALFYAKGEIAARAALLFARRIGGARGESTVILVARAIRSVALGVVVTALVQALLGGIGLAIVGVPYVAILTAVMFMLAVAQIGAVPVLLCSAVWVFWRGDTGWGVALIVWAILVSSMDNILRPVLIRKGIDLPTLLILVGVIGGLVAFGLVGIFIGPIVLAVSYTLIAAWVDDTPNVASAKP